MSVIDDEEGPQPPKKPHAYKVGRGKPPVEYQFPKGTSGNPNGRPRKPRKVITLDPVCEPLSDFITEEVYKPVAILENGKIVMIPMAQVMLRALGSAGAKGNRLAAKNYLDIVQRHEAKTVEQFKTNHNIMLDYQAYAQAQFDAAEAAGRPEPDIIPHPKDLFFNSETGDIDIRGPRDKEHKEKFDGMLEKRADFQAVISGLAKEFWETNEPDERRYIVEEWHHIQFLYDILNDGFPERYKAKLIDRSHRSGASKEGEAFATVSKRKEDRAKEARRKQRRG